MNTSPDTNSDSGIDGENAATPKKRPRRSAALTAEALLISDIRTRRSDANTKETRRQTCSSNSTTLTTTPLAIVCTPFQSTQIATKATNTYQQQRTSASTFALMPIEVEMAAKKVDASMTSIFGISSCGSWAVSNDFSETEQPSTPLSSTDAALHNGQTESGERSKTREQPFGPKMLTLEATKNANEPERVSEEVLTASDLPGTSQRRSSAPVQVPATKNVVQQQAEKFKQGMQSLLKPEKERRRRAEERVAELENDLARLNEAKEIADTQLEASKTENERLTTDLESKRQEITALTDIIQQLRTENGPLVFLREQLAQFVSTHSQRLPIAAGPAPASNSTNTSEGDAQNPAQVQHTQQQQQRLVAVAQMRHLMPSYQYQQPFMAQFIHPSILMTNALMGPPLPPPSTATAERATTHNQEPSSMLQQIAAVQQSSSVEELSPSPADRMRSNNGRTRPTINCKSEEISVVFKKPRTVEKQTLRQHKSAICLMQLPEKGQQRVQQEAAVDADMNPETKSEAFSGQMVNKKRNSTLKHDRNRGKTKMVRMAEAELPLSFESDFHAEESATVQPSLSPSHLSNATENVGSLTSDVIEIEKRKQLQGSQSVAESDVTSSSESPTIKDGSSMRKVKREESEEDWYHSSDDDEKTKSVEDPEQQALEQRRISDALKAQVRRQSLLFTSLQIPP